MIDTHLKMKLEKATVDLDKTTDVEGILIVASDGRILHHNLRVDVDINLFGPMSQVISNSSLRLLNSSGQGEMERVLVESSGGKALFLGLEKVHLIILMQDSANVGMVLVNAKRASQKIHEVTHDLELEVPKETIVEEIPIPEELPVEELPVEELPVEELPVEELPVEELPVEELPVEDIPTTSVATEKSLSETTATKEPPIETVTADEKPVEITTEKTLKDMEMIEEPVVVEEPVAKPVEDLPSQTPSETEEPVLEPVLEKTEKITAEPIAEVNKPAVSEKPPLGIENELETDLKAELETEVEVAETEPEEVKPIIPTVRPPISFPSLPENVEVPEDPEKRSQLILNIYESIFLAMSLGAAKIMGVAPARGLTKQFLPFEKCKRLLENVNLKSNATIDFAQIKKNAEGIPLPEREEIFIQDFNRMIEVITENYGRVMGYEAFRAMVRPEFLEIKKSYGEAMNKLNIKKGMHPEIAHLFT
jgi:predicted regulator of Ras-like GTPase activity (Roadblock/LC7/MglB family)